MNKNTLPPLLRNIAIKIKNKLKDYKWIDDLRAQGALKRLKLKNIEVKTIFDVGASNGSWTKTCMQFYPDSNYFLVEAQKPHEKKLIELSSANENIKFIIAAAGDSNGKIWFDDSSLFGGAASFEKSKNTKNQMPMIKLDTIAQKNNLQGPYLIKLDTHGFEIPILNGAKEILKNTNIVIIEVYNFNICEGSLLFDEMCAHMRKLGFRPIDISDPMWRTNDSSFWQMDIYFVKSDNPAFNDNGYN